MNLNRATLSGLMTAFGPDSTAWIGKVLTVHTEKTTVAGKRVTALYLVPDGFEVGEDDGGYVQIVRKGDAVDGVDDADTEADDAELDF